MECPKCGLINPESAQRCDCGYDFVTVRKHAAHPEAAASRRLPHHLAAPLSEVKGTDDMRDKLEVVGRELATVAVGLGTISLILLWIKGSVWFSSRLIPSLFKALGWLLVVCVVLFLPAGLARKTRRFAAWGLYTSTFAFGMGVWISSAWATFRIWGAVGLLLGFFLSFGAMVPVGYLAAILHREWQILGDLAQTTAVAVATYLSAIYLAKKSRSS